MEERMEFISKVYTKGKSPYPKMRASLKIWTGLIVLMFLFEFLMEGFSIDIIKSKMIIILLTIVSFYNTKPVSGYKSNVVRVDLKEEEIIITYENIDRGDKIGERKEEIRINYKNITKLEYSNPLNCLNIQGYPIELVQYFKKTNKKEFIKDYSQKKEEKRTLIYVSGEEKNKLINRLEEITNMKVNNLD